MSKTTPHTTTTSTTTTTTSPTSSTDLLPPLNDESWSTFLLVLYSDASPIQDEQHLTSFYDCITSGLRSKFTLLGIPACIDWALGNLKSHDVCKEIKATLDNGTALGELPPILIARLIKTRLLALKREGLEIKNAPPVVSDEKEPPNDVCTQPDPTLLKTGASKGKPTMNAKDTERAKSPAKKPAGKAVKPEAIISRPESAVGLDVSNRRKSKAAGKILAKLVEPVVPIGDEPADGPDAYYILKDVLNPTVLAVLMDQLQVPIHAVMNIKFQTTPDKSNGPLHPHSSISLKQHFRSINCMNWIHIAWSEVQHSSSFSITNKDFPKSSDPAALMKDRDKELFETIAKLTYRMVTERKVHDALYVGCQTIPVPIPPKGEANDETPNKRTSKVDLRYYEFIVDSLCRADTDEQTQQGPMAEIVLSAMLEQVVRNDTPNLFDVENQHQSRKARRPSEYPADALDTYIGHATSRLAFAGTVLSDNGSPTLQKSIGVDESSGESNILSAPVFDYNDIIGQKSHNLSRLKIRNETPHDISRAFLNRSPLSVYQYFPSRPTRSSPFAYRSQNLAESSLQRDRALYERDLLQCSSYPANAPPVLSEETLRRALLQYQFETMLNESCREETDEKKIASDGPEEGLVKHDALLADQRSWILDDWNIAERLSRDVLAQTLQHARLYQPNIYTRYLAAEKLLLLAMTAPGPVKDNVCGMVNETWVPTKIGFGLFWKLRTAEHTHPVSDPSLVRPLPTFSIKSTSTLSKPIIADSHLLSVAGDDGPNSSPRVPFDTGSIFQPTPYVYTCGDAVVHELDRCEVLYPSDGGQVRVHNVTQDFEFEQANHFTTLYHREGILRWGNPSFESPYLTFSLTCGSVISVIVEKNTSSATMDISISNDTGLLVQIFPDDGRIVQRYPSRNGRFDRRRTVLSDGTVICHHPDGTVQLLYPNGNTTVKSDDGSIISTDASGFRQGTDKSGKSFALSPLQTVTSGTPSSTTVTREDLVILTTTGTEKIVEHADGTKITMRDDGVKKSVTVVCDGYANVRRNVGDSRDASITMPDGLTITVKQQESVLSGTAPNKEKKSEIRCGIILTKPNGPSVVVYNDGTARYIPSFSCTETKIVDLKADASDTDIIGVYCINFIEGTMAVKDSAGCQYLVRSGRVKVIQNAIPNPQSPSFAIRQIERQPLLKRLLPQPIDVQFAQHRSPRIFAIDQRDGSGIEFLRDADLIHFLACSVYDPDTEIVHEAIPGDEKAANLSLTKRVYDATGGTPRTAMDDSEDSDEKLKRHILTHRQFTRHNRLTPQTRQAILQALQEYSAYKEAIESESDRYLLSDTREPSEKETANSIQARVLEALKSRPRSREFYADSKDISCKKSRRSTEKGSMGGMVGQKVGHENRPRPQTVLPALSPFFIAQSKVIKPFGICAEDIVQEVIITSTPEPDASKLHTPVSKSTSGAMSRSPSRRMSQISNKRRESRVFTPS